jgi:hypothetical protein
MSIYLLVVCSVGRWPDGGACPPVPLSVRSVSFQYTSTLKNILRHDQVRIHAKESCLGINPRELLPYATVAWITGRMVVSSHRVVAKRKRSTPTASISADEILAVRRVRSARARCISVYVAPNALRPRGAKRTVDGATHKISMPSSYLNRE